MSQGEHNANAEARRLVKGFTVESIEAWPHAHPARHALLELARPIVAKGARTVGDWTRPPGLTDEYWFERHQAREGALDEIIRRAVFGGRRPWRCRRRPKHGAKFHGWIHKRDSVKFSTFAYLAGKNDFRDWLKVEFATSNAPILGIGTGARPRGHFEQQPTGSSRPYWVSPDPFANALRDDLATVERVIRGLGNPEHTRILLTLIEQGYDFDNPRNSRGMVRDYAAAHGLSSVQKAQYHLRTALETARERLRVVSLDDDRHDAGPDGYGYGVDPESVHSIR